MALRATRGVARAAAPAAAPANPFPLTYNQIKNKPGLYEHRNGRKILVVFSTDTKIVQDTGVRTGYTRTGQAMYDINEARLRKTVNDHGPDGDAQWREYRGEPLVLANG